MHQNIKKDLLSNNDSKSTKVSVTLLSNTDNSITQEREEGKEEILQFISEEPIAPLTFYKKNKNVMGFTTNTQFKEWLKINNIAISGTGQFIPTDEAETNGLMVNAVEYNMVPVIKKKTQTQLIQIVCNYSGKLTQKGQKYILDKIAQEREENENATVER